MESRTINLFYDSVDGCKNVKCDDLYQILKKKLEFHALIKDETMMIFTGEFNALDTSVLQATAKTCIKLCLCLLLFRKQVKLSVTAYSSAYIVLNLIITPIL